MVFFCGLLLGFFCLLVIFFLKDTHCIFNMSKAIVKVMVDPVFISYNTEVIARIFTVTDDRKRSVLFALKTYFRIISSNSCYIWDCMLVFNASLLKFWNIIFWRKRLSVFW